MVVRVIVIIATASSGVGVFFLLFFGIPVLIKAEEFAKDGDAAPNTTNIVRHRGVGYAPCFPSGDSFLLTNRLEAANVQIRRERRKGAMSLEEMRDRAGFTLVDAGSRVWVTEERISVSAPLAEWGPNPPPNYYIPRTLVRVESRNNAFESCFMLTSSLEMGLFEWVRWKVGQ